MAAGERGAVSRVAGSCSSRARRAVRQQRLHAPCCTPLRCESRTSSRGRGRRNASTTCESARQSTRKSRDVRTRNEDEDEDASRWTKSKRDGFPDPAHRAFPLLSPAIETHLAFGPLFELAADDLAFVVVPALGVLRDGDGALDVHVARRATPWNRRRPLRRPRRRRRSRRGRTRLRTTGTERAAHAEVGEEARATLGAVGTGAGELEPVSSLAHLLQASAHGPTSTRRLRGR